LCLTYLRPPYQHRGGQGTSLKTTIYYNFFLELPRTPFLANLNFGE
jgi:hypothetical protein